MSDYLLNIILDEMADANNVFSEKLETVKNYMLSLQKENEKLRDALEFYADPEHWGNEEVNSWNDYDESNGSFARKVLKELGE